VLPCVCSVFAVCLQCVAVCCSVFAVCLQCVCSVLQCVAVRCSSVFNVLHRKHIASHLIFKSNANGVSMCDMTHSYVGRDSCNTWIRDMTRSSPVDLQMVSIRGTWLIHMWDMTHSCEWHGSLLWAVWFTEMFLTSWLITRRDVT